MRRPTWPGSRPKRVESFWTSDFGVPMPGRTSLPASRVASASPIASTDGSAANRARRGA